MYNNPLPQRCLKKIKPPCIAGLADRSGKCRALLYVEHFIIIVSGISEPIEQYTTIDECRQYGISPKSIKNLSTVEFVENSHAQHPSDTDEICGDSRILQAIILDNGIHSRAVLSGDCAERITFLHSIQL